jgi:hypothetical protein
MNPGERQRRFNETKKKALDEIFGLVRAGSFARRRAKERLPIEPANLATSVARPKKKVPAACVRREEGAI